MGEPILIYDSGTTYYIDSFELYDPFPEPEEESKDEDEDSQNLQML